MTHHKFIPPANRRNFLGKVTGAAALMGVASLISPAKANAKEFFSYRHTADPDEWFKGIKGKHRIVFDCTEPKEVFPFAWPKIFQMSNAGTGTPDSTAVVVFRHNAYVYALQDSLWAKYKFGEMLNIKDPETKAAAIRNPFWQPKPDDFKIPGVGPVQLGIPELQAGGVMFCVCDIALTVNSAAIAMKTNQDAAVVKKEFLAAMIPNIPAMPSGVWAVGRAQENGCGYCYV
jgi:intracellular sulfur oxidation DsrE/DsrF family protein